MPCMSKIRKDEENGGDGHFHRLEIPTEPLREDGRIGGALKPVARAFPKPCRRRMGRFGT